MPAAIAPLDSKIDALKCMGDWHVQVAIPTPFDKQAHNGLEHYEWDEKAKRVRVTYTFNDGSFTGKETVVHQVGRVNPKSENGTKWQVAPIICCCAIPMWLDYIIIDIDSTDYTYMVCSSPTTSGMAPW